MKLYSGPLSLFTAKVRIALDEKQLEFQRVDVGWSLARRYLPHHPDVIALNPKREVPVLVDGELVVYDSTLILEYLEDRYPERPLFPEDVAERARCRQLEAAADEIIFPAVWDLIEESLYPAPPEGRDPARLEAARAGLDARFLELDKELAGREYLCGEFSVADIGTFIMLSAAANLGHAPGAELSGLTGWLARVRARPTCRREMEGMAAFLAKALAGN